MKKNILIIDDERIQAEGLRDALKDSMVEGYVFRCASEKEEVLESIKNSYYDLAVIDIRLEGYGYSGIDLVEIVKENNPHAKVVLVSAFTAEFFKEIKKVLLSGFVYDVMDKKTNHNDWVREIKSKIEGFFLKVNKKSNLYKSALLDLYADVKNEGDSYKKGLYFERFLIILFQNMGFDIVRERVKDASTEVDLVVRNDIQDSFLSRFGKYIIIEAKNNPNDKIDKNVFVLFKDKVEHSGGLVQLGIIATTGLATKTVDYESIRNSGKSYKILILTNVELMGMIEAENKLEAFKGILDRQTRSLLG